MSYFSRLSEIVTCNLSDLLSNSANPGKAIEQIIHEMEEGLSGAHRSVASAIGAEERLRKDIEDHCQDAARWAAQAKTELQNGAEERARVAIHRKLQVEALMAGLELQLKAAVSTRTHLETTQRAIQARLAEAQRRMQLLRNDAVTAQSESFIPEEPSLQEGCPEQTEAERVEAELEALKRELQQGT